MFSQNSIFKALSPQPASTVFVSFDLLEQPVVPDGAEVNNIFQDDGEISVNVE